ncbi:hypothetical protein [Streptomyces sp. NPDC047097]|uniref:hypothetical protein n=1 Tax=Streptomyces sp. NPDC047097 TaxID=3155260 RepID=UPI0033D8AEA8
MTIKWERAVGGRKLEQFLALMDGVQLSLTETQFEMQVRAEENLNQAKSRRGGPGALDASRASIETDRGRVDRFVVLQDSSSSRQGGDVNSALAIELGRNAYDVTVLNAAGDPVREYEVGAMQGLYVLTDAANLPRKRKGGAKGKRHVKVRMKGGGRGRPSRRD